MATVPTNPDALRRRRAVQRTLMARLSRDRFAAEAAAEARGQPLIYEPDNRQAVRVEYLPVTVTRQPARAGIFATEGRSKSPPEAGVFATLERGFPSRR